ncbi:aminoacyl-tRNA deacylase [Demequina oxidasica]|uniref:aminoacyl-tRNA deacylase n=1 Tax=Demequina oxidasica TaxID=676199 RepID=UPI000A073AD3
MTDNSTDATSTSDDASTNPALDALARSGLEYHVVRHENVDSLEEAAQARGLDPRQVLKTLVVRRASGDYLFILVPGDRQISWPKMREHLGVNRISMPDATKALEVTGYVRGTITPFGSHGSANGTPWPVIADALIASRAGISANGTAADAGASETGAAPFAEVSIGGGAPGVSATLAADALIDYLNAEVADVTDPAVIYAEPPYWNVTMDALDSTDRLGYPLHLTPGALHSRDVMEALKAALTGEPLASFERAASEARRRLPTPNAEQIAQAEADFRA